MPDALSDIERPAPTIPGWKGNFVGNNIFQYRLESPGRLVLDGTTQNLTVHVSRAHRLVRLALKHTDSSDADSLVALTIFVQQEILFPTSLFVTMFGVNNFRLEAGGSIILGFGETYEETGTRYRIQLQGTSTNRVYPILTIQYLGFKGGAK